MTAVIKGIGQNIKATAAIAITPGITLIGIFVSAASATPTITVYDDATGGTTNKIVDTFTPTAATFYPLYLNSVNGWTIAISGTVSCTPVLG